MRAVQSVVETTLLYNVRILMSSHAYEYTIATEM
jgi:hypothetical protein